ncbi:MAG: hypothetical protein GY733_03860 [bacterium]|nr:hypothetical protein [bacterium]
MMRRGLVLALLLLATALACGKYGKPERVVDAPVAAASQTDADSDDQAKPKARKP